MGCLKLNTGASNFRTPYLFPYKIEIMHLMRFLSPVDCHNIYCRGVSMSKMTFYAFFCTFLGNSKFSGRNYLSISSNFGHTVSEYGVRSKIPVRQDYIIIGQDYINPTMTSPWQCKGNIMSADRTCQCYYMLM